MLAGGLAGGVVERRRPAWVLRPATGFALGLSASLLRYALASGFSALFRLNRPPLSLGMEAQTASIEWGGSRSWSSRSWLQVRAREDWAGAAMAEVRSLQESADEPALPV